MNTQERALKVIELSDRIQAIIENRDQMTNGDYQGAIEAVIMTAVQLQDAILTKGKDNG